ncbi:MAG: hypothetical protein MZV64_47775 [Ignavibacteriales bacterium]|nr:hypothetical protein [Ignavibacteriales bacterium]
MVNEPYCKISPRYEWIENYSEQTFIDRLFNAKLIESNKYKLSDLKIKSRFNSGRVNELDIIVNDGEEIQKTIFLMGNQIRSIIRSGDGKSILRSTLFNISIDKSKNISYHRKRKRARSWALSMGRNRSIKKGNRLRSNFKSLLSRNNNKKFI